MEKRDEETVEGRTTRSGRRKYEAPEILSEEVFETTALACMKVTGKGGCGAFPKS